MILLLVVMLVVGIVIFAVGYQVGWSHGTDHLVDDLSDKIYNNGEPCDHAGCLSHVTHPCEGCGRVAGRYLKPESIPLDLIQTTTVKKGKVPFPQCPKCKEPMTEMKCGNKLLCSSLICEHEETIYKI